MTQAICTGSAYTEDRAIEWLKARGATVASVQAVTVIVLPESARLESDGRYWRYAITFYGPDGDEEETYVEMEHYADAYETVLRLIEPTPEPSENLYGAAGGDTENEVYDGREQA